MDINESWKKWDKTKKKTYKWISWRLDCQKYNDEMQRKMFGKVNFMMMYCWQFGGILSQVGQMCCAMQQIGQGFRQLANKLKKTNYMKCLEAICHIWCLSCRSLQSKFKFGLPLFFFMHVKSHLEHAVNFSFSFVWM